MLILSVLLLVIGAVFLTVEFHIPGFGVCGITGLALIIASVVVTVLKVPFGPYIVIAELAGLGVFGYYMIRYLKKRQLYGKLILDETLNYERTDIGDLDSFVGKEGVTKTSLKPFGRVSFNGVDVDAWADGEYISEDVRVKVVGVENEKVYVKAINTN